jgi:heptosyltransferase-1
MRVLIIKLTSMGDLMHAFPALTDAVKHIPDISFDWVVDESFAEVPKWHPAVNQVITTAHRRWKKNLYQAYKNGEFSQFYHQLNASNYDVVIDLQSNLKSAFVSWLRKSDVHGYDKSTCREKPAHWSYQHHYAISLRQHAIERQRALFSKIFNYVSPEPLENFECDYGVDLSAYELPALALPEKYVVCVHNASWPTKLWPLSAWRELITRIANQDFSILLPCGSDKEYQRAQEIADGFPDAIALPKMSLNEMAAIMSNAQAAVCSDTGLAHMAAVASTPAITLYAVTDTLLIGTAGKNQLHLVAKKDSASDLEDTVEKHQTSPVMSDISVDDAWQYLLPMLKTSTKK